MQSYFVWVFSAPASCANYGNGHLHIMWAFQFSQSLHNIQNAILTNHSSIMLKTKTILTNHSAIIQKTKSKDDTHKSLYKNECEYRKDNTADNKRWTRWRGHLSGRSLQAAIQFRNRRKRLPLLTDSGFCLWQKRPRPAALRARISKSLEFYCTVFHFLRLFRIFS